MIYYLRKKRKITKKRHIYLKKYYQKHKKKINAYVRKWNKEFPNYNKQYYQKNRKEKLTYRKKYYKKNWKKIQTFRNKYYQKHKKEMRAYAVKRYKKYPEKHRAFTKKFRQKNPTYAKKWRQKNSDYLKKYSEKYNKKMRIHRKKSRYQNIGKWLHHFPKKLRCEICNKNLVFLNKEGKKGNNVVFFDHKIENLPIGPPRTWLMSHPPNPKNKKLWNSCDFGILCDRCNLRLPTKNRIKWIKRVAQYMGLIILEKKEFKR